MVGRVTSESLLPGAYRLCHNAASDKMIKPDSEEVETTRSYSDKKAMKYGSQIGP